MERIGVRELRQHASRYLARVRAGNTVEITDRGVLVALLVPPGESRSTRDRLIADGRLIPAANPTGRIHAPQPVRDPADRPSNRDLLDLERAERL